MFHVKHYGKYSERMFFYDVTMRGNLSLYEYLYRCIRHDIAHGVIAPGEKLPSKRALAKHLGVSRITIEAAYEQLVAEGYIRSRERCGYYACDLAPPHALMRKGTILRLRHTQARSQTQQGMRLQIAAPCALLSPKPSPVTPFRRRVGR